MHLDGGLKKTAVFLSHRKLRNIDPAVLLCEKALDRREDSAG